MIIYRYPHHFRCFKFSTVLVPHYEFFFFWSVNFRRTGSVIFKFFFFKLFHRWLKDGTTKTKKIKKDDFAKSAVTDDQQMECSAVDPQPVVPVSWPSSRPPRTAFFWSRDRPPVALRRRRRRRRRRPQRRRLRCACASVRRPVAANPPSVGTFTPDRLHAFRSPSFTPQSLPPPPSQSCSPVYGSLASKRIHEFYLFFFSSLKPPFRDIRRDHHENRRFVANYPIAVAFRRLALKIFFFYF